MDMDHLKRFINTSFLAVFPHGWIGRPWDNVYTLEEIRNEQDSIILALSGGIKISFGKNSQLIFLKNSLIFVGININVSYGGESFLFENGPVTFMREEMQENFELFEIHQKLIDFFKGEK